VPQNYLLPPLSDRDQLEELDGTPRTRAAQSGAKRDVTSTSTHLADLWDQPELAESSIEVGQHEYGKPHGERTPNQSPPNQPWG
jgi:hypothetical protein